MKWCLTWKIEIILFSALVMFALFFSFTGFAERPGIWFDEGITIEIARNFALFGELDTLTAPDSFSGVPHLVGTNGYPLTIPLALFFKIFGAGLIQARIFMIGWLLATLGMLYFITRRLFGAGAALSATALTVSFASFYGNGLTATGEMPGLFFFLLGIWLLVEKKNYWATGAVWGLAMAAKPGVFLLLAHTIFFYVIFADRERWFKKMLHAGIGLSIPILAWILLAFPFTMGTFYSVVTYVLNPINIPAVTSFFERLPAQTLNEGLVVPAAENIGRNVRNNFALLATHSTTQYFFLLGVAVIFGLYRGRKKNCEQRGLLWVIVLYAAPMLIFFVRGPGWFRYLFGLQILLFMPLYQAIREGIVYLKSRVSRVVIPLYLGPLPTQALVVGALVMLQIFQLYFLSNIPISKGVIESVTYVQAKMEANPDAILGIYNLPEMAAFTDPYRTYHISLPQSGLPPLGESPLLLKEKPNIVVMNKKRSLVGQAEEQVLETLYAQAEEVYNYYVYEKR